MRLLFVRPRLIGDVVLTTPLVRAVRRAWPAAHLAYLVEPAAAPIVLHNPHLDDVIVAPRGRGAGRLATDLALARRLRRERFDVVLDLHGGPRSSLLARATGAPVRVGYRVDGRSWLYTKVANRPRDLRPRHSVENQWDVLAAWDARFARTPSRADDPVEMRNTAAEHGRIEHRLQAMRIAAADQLIVVHVTAGNRFRQWPAEHFAQLTAGLASGPPNRRIILATAAAQALTAHQVRALVDGASPGTGTRVAVASDVTLGELRALIDRAALFIGNDSGPLHVASTTATPIVGIYGPTSGETWAPWRDPALVTELVDNGPLPCRPCTQRRCEPGDFRCLTALAPARVHAAAERALSRAERLDGPITTGRARRGPRSARGSA